MPPLSHGRIRDAYASYNEHPEHVRFVQERWEDVVDFLEIDSEALGDS